MNRKNSYKNLDKWKEACKRQRKKYYDKTTKVKNSGKPWNKEDDEIVLKHEIPDKEISQKIQRSMRTIIARRAKLKKGGNNGTMARNSRKTKDVR